MQLYTVGADGLGLTQLTTLPGGAFEGRWSPDGTRLAFVSFGPLGTAPGAAWIPQLFVGSADASGAQTLTSSLGAKGSPSWLPAGDSLVFHWDQAGASLWTISANGGQPTVLNLLAGPARHASAAADGNWAVEGYGAGGTGDSKVFWGAPGQPLSMVQAGPGEEMEPVWDPAGQRVAFVYRAVGQPAQLWVYDTRTGQAQAWTHSAAFHLHPAWSPDGSRLACSVFNGGSWSLALVDAGGTETLLNLALAHPQVWDWR